MKFRVYDKQEKKYADYQLHFYIDSDGDLFFDKNKMEIHEDLSLCDPDRYVVEFSTGRKDKNGKELFQSDEVIDHYKRIMVCEYSQYFLKWLWVAKSTTNFLFADINQWKSEEFEIIGNIHDGEADGKARVSNFNFL